MNRSHQRILLSATLLLLLTSNSPANQVQLDPLDFSSTPEALRAVSLSTKKETSVLECTLPKELHKNFSIIIHASQCPSLKLLTENLTKTYKSFERDFGEVKGTFNLIIGAGLNSGYDLKTDTIFFADTPDIDSFGLKSTDFQIHEFFHALTCKKYPGFCQKVKNIDSESSIVAEATADYYAYLTHPDNCFGENYYFKKPCIRNYHTHHNYALVDGVHEKANILVHYMIQTKMPISAIQKFFDKQNNSPSEDVLQSFVPEADRRQFYIGNFAFPDFEISATNLTSRMKGQVFSFQESHLASIKITPNENFLKTYSPFEFKLVPENVKEKDPFQTSAPSVHDYTTSFEITPPHEVSAYQKFHIIIYSGKKEIGLKRIFFQISKSGPQKD